MHYRAYEPGVLLGTVNVKEIREHFAISVPVFISHALFKNCQRGYVIFYEFQRLELSVSRFQAAVIAILTVILF